MRRWIGVAVAVASVAAWGMRPLVAQAPDFGGSWMINRDLSTPPGSQPGPPPEGRGGRGRGGGGGMGGPGGRGGPGGGRGGFGRGGGRGGGPRGGDPKARRDAMEARRALMDEILAMPPRVTIAQDGDRLTLIEPDGVVRTYVANGKKEKHQLTNGVIETATSWDGSRLKMTVAAGDRVRLVRTFEVKADPRRLEVITAFERAPDDARQVTVYDEAEQGR